MFRRSFTFACLALGHAAVCNDDDISCANWAKQDECQREGAGLASLCPVSCRTCPTPMDCKETKEDCEQWARQGECESNPGHMLQDCPISCGLCTVVSPAGTENHSPNHKERGPCVNHKHMCSQWAENNQCNENPRFMALECPSTCEVCKPACVDLHADCPGWAADGECHKNPEFVMKKCPKACDVCGDTSPSVSDSAAGSSGATPLCVDHNTTQCHIWADSGECESNPIAVVKLCPQTCGACSMACMDHDDRCRAWAFDGKCHAEADENYMVRVCPAACGICAALDRRPM